MDRVRPEILKISPTQPEEALVNYAAEQIRKGQVISVPTDTYYGLAADPFNLRAVERIYEIKARGRHKPLSLIVSSPDQAEELAATIPDEFHILTEKLWPGPLTIIVKAAPRLPLKVTANTGNIAVRLPATPIAVAIAKAAGSPITSTSASLTGMPDCVTAQEVTMQMGERLPVVVDGGTSPHHAFTTIVSLAENHGGWKLLREGVIPAHQIEDLLGDQ
jgi:tRNA threonylcarbamoyl adenosine modification protein (Sua5/YciO/YrdC/YwlC family)